MNNTEFASYADDNTLNTMGNDTEDGIQRLQATLINLFQWFANNKIKANADKCHFICRSNKKLNLILENEEIANNIYVQSISVLKLTLNSHLPLM